MTRYGSLGKAGPGRAGHGEEFQKGMRESQMRLPFFCLAHIQSLVVHARRVGRGAAIIRAVRGTLLFRRQLTNRAVRRTPP